VSSSRLERLCTGFSQMRVFSATRAVTIDARPEQIWPWLVQMGDQRAGFYGYDWIDNGGIASADRIIPALQHLKVGDDIRIGLGTFKVVALEPNHSLVWASPNGEWSMALALYPVDANHTRLVWRIHGIYDWTSLYSVPQLFTDGAEKRFKNPARYLFWMSFTHNAALLSRSPGWGAECDGSVSMQPTVVISW
jgi:hypothetical protein